jgi:hypothetical protein
MWQTRIGVSALTAAACDGKTGACSFTVKAGGSVPACDGAIVGGRCMKAFQAASTRAAAEQACVVWGGHLTRVGSAQENASVRLLATQGCGGAVPAWIGLNDLAVEGKYEWPDGGAFGYSNWNPGEPNNCDACCGAPEDVVQMIDNGHWNDICSNQVMTCYVCQRPLPALGWGPDAARPDAKKTVLCFRRSAASATVAGNALTFGGTGGLKLCGSPVRYGSTYVANRLANSQPRFLTAGHRRRHAPGSTVRKARRVPGAWRRA